ncbi:hypothetical protein COL26b_008290 [Colletotrichum chrysophilum]|uniref:uncharacterized protein n=1 Tax=Colletotrichum chrysophilum TaxID=1836956 RepID=UPI002300F874|nr:uncharacterized protein COL26b_008290 [Colletotrichum chrysophilum]KAJ0373432.1 hypothetical protein COL26b_008290 [Colletotrichum chrysophilum]
MATCLPHCLTFSPDETWLACFTTAQYDWDYSLMLINVESDSIKWIIKIDNYRRPAVIAFDPTGSRIVVGARVAYQDRIDDGMNDETDDEMDVEVDAEVDDEVDDETDEETDEETDDGMDDELSDALDSEDDEIDDGPARHT